MKKIRGLTICPVTLYLLLLGKYNLFIIRSCLDFSIQGVSVTLCIQALLYEVNSLYDSLLGVEWPQRVQTKFTDDLVTGKDIKTTFIINL